MKLGTTKELSYHNTFIEAVDNGIEEILEPKQTLPWSNISKSEKTIINELLKRDNLVFTKSRQRRSYSNTRCWKLYRKSKQRFDQEHTKIIKDSVQTFQRQQILTKNICDNLKTTKLEHHTSTKHLKYIKKICQEGQLYVLLIVIQVSFFPNSLFTTCSDKQKKLYHPMLKTQ